MLRFSLQRSNLYGDFSIARGQVKPGIFEKRMDFQEYDEEIMKRYFCVSFFNCLRARLERRTAEFSSPWTYHMIVKYGEAV